MSTPVHQRAPGPKGEMPPADPDVVAHIPSFASREYVNAPTAFDPDFEDSALAPRRFRDRWTDLITAWMTDPTRAFIGERIHRAPSMNVLHYLTKPYFPLKPELYTDMYMTPNKCPEEYWFNPWRWAQTKRVNPKIPPPINGRYNDFYHFLAFKWYILQEREVYMAHLALLQEMMIRCSMKEGVNATKNCRHLWNKYFSMSRHEEYTQSLLYMTITGDTVIRETPYPPDFIDQKRKIYDDWLTRTRMRMPGDCY